MRISTIQKLCSWSGIVCVILFFGGFFIAGIVPPLAPDLSQAQIAGFYQTHQTAIMLGSVVWMLSCLFMCFFIGIISEQMKRIQGAPPGLSYAQIAAGTLNMVFFILPPAFLVVTAYRPDRPPELTYLLNDLTWITTVLPWPPACAESIAIGVAILSDKGATPIFPRWTGWANLVIAALFAPATGMVFVTSGMFAWSGLFAFWIPGLVFTAWFIIMHWALLRAIKAQAIAG